MMEQEGEVDKEAYETMLEELRRGESVTVLSAHRQVVSEMLKRLGASDEELSRVLVSAHETTRHVDVNELLEVVRESLTKTIDEKYGAVSQETLHNLWHAMLILALDAGVNAVAPGATKPTAEESFRIYDESLDVIERAMQADHEMAVSRHDAAHVLQHRLSFLLNRYLSWSRDRKDEERRHEDARLALLKAVAAFFGAERKGKFGEKLDRDDVAWVKSRIIAAAKALTYDDEIVKPSKH